MGNLTVQVSLIILFMLTTVFQNECLFTEFTLSDLVKLIIIIRKKTRFAHSCPYDQVQDYLTVNQVMEVRNVQDYCFYFEHHSKRSTTYLQEGAQATKDPNQQTTCAASSSGTQRLSVLTDHSRALGWALYENANCILP